MTFATKFRNLRKRLGLSQAEAGELLGLSRQAITFYEGGDRCPPVEPVRTQAQILADLERLAKQREK